MQNKSIDERLVEQNKILTAVNSLSIELASIPFNEDIYKTITRRLMDITGSIAVTLGVYDPETGEIIIKHLETDSNLLNQAKKILGYSPAEIRAKVTSEIYDTIITERVSYRETLREVSFNEIPEGVSKVLMTVLNIQTFAGMAYVLEDKLFGTSLLAFKKGATLPSLELLSSLSNVIALSLRRHKAESELHQSLKEQKSTEEKFQVIAQHIQDCIFMTDPKGTIIYMSPSCKQLFGFEPPEMMGRTFILYLHKDEVQRAMTRYQMAMQDHKVDEPLVLRMLRKDGEVFIGELVTCNFYEDDKVKGNIGIIRDITERQKAHDELNNLNNILELRVNQRTEELETLNRELEAFSYTITHDLKSPLRSITGFSKSLLEDYSEVLDEEGKDYLQRINSSAGFLTQLIDDMLKLSKLTKAEINTVDVNISNLVKAEIEALQEAEPNRKAEIIIQPDIIVKGDNNLVRVVVQNLISNAWKFSAPKDTAKIEFGAEQKNGFTLCFVRDNGVGFDMNYYDKLFGTFQRLHSAEEFSGTGIGLVSAKRVIDKHKGEIWAESVLNEGTVFYFHFGG